MRLLRIVQHVREQHWTAIGIDFAIVVIGVFVGIQVANWNAARVDEIRAQAYLARIEDNLRTDLESMQRREAFWRKVTRHGNDAIRYAETGALVDGSAWKTVLAFYQASQVWIWTSNDTTYQELLNGGELNLIKDDGLRSALSTYYLEGSSEEIGFILTMIPEYRKIVRGLSPAVVSAQIWANCHRNPNYYEQDLIDCGSPMPESDAQAVLDAYTRDPDLLAELRFWVTNQTVAAQVITNNKDSAVAILRRMGVEAAP
jgi:hypothetical protein